MLTKEDIKKLSNLLLLLKPVVIFQSTNGIEPK